jgi:calcium/calmodulin-dependent protein kinase I
MTKTFEEAYDLNEQLGKGAYAVVYKCTNKASGELWAVKVIDKSKAGPKDIDDVLHEVTMMKTVGYHPNVIQLKEFFDTPKFMYLILDLVTGGMLFDRIIQMKHYSELQASRVVKNLLLALEHIHSKGIIHRDLKPENLLLKHNNVTSPTDISYLTDVALADFGLSGKSPGQTCCGSPTYVAPEVINVGYLRTQKEPYDSKCDIWSLGVITYILLSGKMPFHGKMYKETFQKIVKNQWGFIGDIWEHVSAASKDFIKTMLTPDPKLRPSATEALKHKWVSEVQADIHLMASVDGLRQFTAQQKLKAVVAVFRATTSFLGGLDKTPPFMKYLNHKDKLSTVIESQSQTDPTKTHTVDFSHALRKDEPGWKLKDACSCGSKQVCRHIQNVNEYLFVGKRSMDVYPFINELQTMRDDAEFDMVEEPGNKAAEALQKKLVFIIHAAEEFAAELAKVPAEDQKVNFMLQSSRGFGKTAAALAKE